VEKYCGARQATNDNIIQRMRFACWIIKAKDTYSEYVILIEICALLGFSVKSQKSSDLIYTAEEA
jgi:hypothetical protein